MLIQVLNKISDTLESINEVVRSSVDSVYPPRIEIKERP